MSALVDDLDCFISEYNMSDNPLNREIDDAYISAYHLKQIAMIEHIPIIVSAVRSDEMPHLNLIDEFADIVLTGDVIGSNIDIHINKFRSANLVLQAKNRKDKKIKNFITDSVWV